MMGYHFLLGTTCAVGCNTSDTFNAHEADLSLGYHNVAVVDHGEKQSAALHLGNSLLHNGTIVMPQRPPVTWLQHDANHFAVPDNMTEDFERQVQPDQ